MHHKILIGHFHIRPVQQPKNCYLNKQKTGSCRGSSSVNRASAWSNTLKVGGSIPSSPTTFASVCRLSSKQEKANWTTCGFDSRSTHHFMQVWCNGSLRLFQSLREGSIPSTCTIFEYNGILYHYGRDVDCKSTALRRWLSSILRCATILDAGLAQRRQHVLCKHAEKSRVGSSPTPGSNLYKRCSMMFETQRSDRGKVSGRYITQSGRASV